MTQTLDQAQISFSNYVHAEHHSLRIQKSITIEILTEKTCTNISMQRKKNASSYHAKECTHVELQLSDLVPL